jgi:hypothetical protein
VSCCYLHIRSESSWTALTPSMPEECTTPISCREQAPACWLGTSPLCTPACRVFYIFGDVLHQHLLTRKLTTTSEKQRASNMSVACMPLPQCLSKISNGYNQVNNIVVGKLYDHSSPHATPPIQHPATTDQPAIHHQLLASSR